MDSCAQIPGPIYHEPNHYLPALFMQRLLRSWVWPSFRPSSGLEPCECPVARPSNSRSLRSAQSRKRVPSFTVSPRRCMNNADKRRTPMSAPRDSRCRYKECYNCKHRFDSITGDKPEYQCGLAIDGTIRVFECGGYRYYLPATKAQRREQHEKLTEYQVS
jgi:hypothetical protein